MKTKVCFLFVLSISVIFPTSIAYANGLGDLKSALSLLQSNSDIKAEYEYRYTNSNDDDEDQHIDSGDVKMFAESNSTGLQLTYSSEIMHTLEVETALRAQDEDADTPTRNALNDINAIDISSVLNASQGLERLLEQVTLVDEVAFEREGRALRQLNFTLPLNALIRDKQTRKYVKKFSNAFQIIIDKDGIPVESSLTFEGKGRAYIVIRVEASGETKSTYEVHEGRLITVHSKDINRWDTTFGEGEQVSEEVVNIQP